MKPHRARIIAMQALFQYDFLLENKGLYEGNLLDYLNQFLWLDYTLADDEKTFVSAIVSGTIKQLKEIDEQIIHFSENWEFSRIGRVAKAVLRISLFQMMDNSVLKIPKKVAIDEGIRLVKEYAEEDAKRFVNGILDGYYKSIQ